MWEVTAPLNSSSSMCVRCQMRSSSWCHRDVDRSENCFDFFFSRQADQGTRGGAVSKSVLLTSHSHALSLTHCLTPSSLFCHSVSSPSSHILLSSSTYFPGGGGCRSVWGTQSETGTDSPRCTDHSGGLHPLSSPLRRSLARTATFCFVLFHLGPLFDSTSAQLASLSCEVNKYSTL